MEPLDEQLVVRLVGVEGETSMVELVMLVKREFVVMLKTKSVAKFVDPMILLVAISFYEVLQTCNIKL